MGQFRFVFGLCLRHLLKRRRGFGLCADMGGGLGSAHFQSIRDNPHTLMRYRVWVPN